MKSISYWEQSTFFSNIDVAIIGSGIVGLSAAIYLKKISPNLKVTVIERGVLPSGASTKNAGFACFGSMTELVDDLRNRSENAVFNLVEKRWKGLQKLRNLLGDQAIGYQHFGGYELFLPHDENVFHECLSHTHQFNLHLKEITGKKQTFQLRDGQINNFGFAKTKHLIFNSAEGQIDTGRMMKSLISKARGLNIEILNGLKVIKLEELGNKVKLRFSGGFSLVAKKTIVATNGFAAQLLDGLDLKPARNQVLVTEAIPDLPFQGCFHIDRGYFYFRSIDSADGKTKRILFGGGRNLAPAEETTSEFGQTSLIQTRLEQMLREIIFPKRQLKIEMRWSGILGIGESKKPILKKISPSIIVAIRLGGMGVAIGSLTGEDASRIVLEEL